MTIYIVELSNDTEAYVREIEAETPEQAVAFAGLPYAGFIATFSQASEKYIATAGIDY
jgi:hypothetical protein